VAIAAIEKAKAGGIVGLSVVPLNRAKVAAACVTSDSDCAEIALLKSKILARLDARFSLNSFIMIATLLNPASKNKTYLNMSLEDKRDLLIAAIEKAKAGGIVSVGCVRSTSLLQRQVVRVVTLQIMLYQPVQRTMHHWILR